MDILISSNLERLLYHLSGGNGKEIAGLMESLKKNGKYTVHPSILYKLDKFHGGFATMDRVSAAIGYMYEKFDYLMDTHTGVGYRVYEDYIAYTGDRTPALLASTASPFKFAKDVADAIGMKEEENGFEYIKAVHAKTGVMVPEGLKDLEHKEVRHTGVVKVEEMESAVRDALSK